MSQRRENYRAALRREQDDVSGPRSTKVTTLQSRYVRVTVEVDPDLQSDLTRWVVRPVSSVVLVGTTVLRTLVDTVGRVTRPGG
ncbi:hypothetical protein CP981_33720 [Streptomyces platensis]|uniref:Uncharacterized protein n=1 Tax=Streptomyces platensis TaxID=58346 RepID=A0AAE6NMT7_STRPT|nr:hypothetical protein [Streptomyces platensis]OSY48488.1 hypothetical protein BG653_00365 [Streptomyces platensis]QEV55904.1 hypothetical protein CP981_33720 [Streptomyces platensis]